MRRLVGLVIAAATASWLLMGANGMAALYVLLESPVQFAAQYPLITSFALSIVFISGAIGGFLWARSAAAALAAGVALVAWNLLTSFVFVPFAIGELEPEHGLQVFAAISLLGTQVLAGAFGVLAGRVTASRRRAALPRVG